MGAGLPAACSFVTGHFTPSDRHEKDNASSEDVAPTSSDSINGPRSQGTVNGSHSRPHSESSGEFSLSLDNEAWSSSSSPVQQPPSHRSSRQSPQIFRRSLEPPVPQAQGTASSPGSEVLSLQQFLRENKDPTESDRQEAPPMETSRRTSDSARAEPKERAARSGAGRPALRKAESARVKVRAASTSDCPASSTLPRASSVISTAEGTTRRTSIHDFLSKDARSPVSVDPAPPAARPRPVSTSRIHTLQAPPPLTKSASVPGSAPAPPLAL
ncbi:hypothetical protein ANANG_G00304390 [Anguilla anguilla]|uniref:Uncharacterized protein n=1 Tax=Anguilla anguilla TaxID=7936 RepID=A0A9D3LRR4_ANGAN|nr:hypothetical protein ANANG_G00304390 [Anguilla anguilla]